MRLYKNQLCVICATHDLIKYETTRKGFDVMQTQILSKRLIHTILWTLYKIILNANSYVGLYFSIYSILNTVLRTSIVVNIIFVFVANIYIELAYVSTRKACAHERWESKCSKRFFTHLPGFYLTFYVARTSHGICRITRSKHKVCNSKYLHFIAICMYDVALVVCVLERCLHCNKRNYL